MSMTADDLPDEIRRFLEMDASDADDRERYLGNPPSGTEVAILVTTTDGSYPTTPNVFFKCNVVGLTGTEVEGGTWSTSTGIGGPGSIYAANLGSAVPPLGTYVLGVKVPERWVFIYSG